MEQYCRPVRRALAANSTASSFASKIPTITEPSNDGVVPLLDQPGRQDTGIVPRRVKLWFIGLGSDEDAYSVRVIGWSRVKLNNFSDLWIPSLITELAVVVGTAVGVAGSAVLNTERFADTITPVAAHQPDRVIAAGTALNSNFQVLSPVGNLIGYAVVPVEGFEKLEFTFADTTGTCTKNVLYSQI